MSDLFFGRPRDKSVEAYREFIMEWHKAMTGDEDDPYTPEQWAGFTADFWGAAKMQKSFIGHQGRRGQVGGSLPRGAGGGGGTVHETPAVGGYGSTPMAPAPAPMVIGAPGSKGIRVTKEDIDSGVKDVSGWVNKNSGLEAAHMLTVRGDTVLVPGTSDSVHMSRELLSNTKYIAHNHPNGASFSGEDVVLLLAHPKMKRIDALSPDGVLFSLECTKRTKKLSGDLWTAAYQVRDSWHRLSGFYRESFQERFDKGEDKFKLWREHTDKIMKDLSQTLGLRYTQTQVALSKAVGALLLDTERPPKEGDYILDDSSIAVPPYGQEAKSFTGHRGRPGQVGGSLPRGGGAVSAATMKSDMEKELSQIKSNKRADAVAVGGMLNANNIKAIGKNAKAELGQYSNYLAGDTNNAARDFIDHMEGLLAHPDLTHIKAEHIDAVLRDSIRKMVYQEVESNRQQFTDHGIRHIVGNVERMDTIYKEAMGAKSSAMDRLMGAFIMVNHDVGYTVAAVRQGGIEGIKASSGHPAHSEKILREQSKQWNEGKIFSKEQYDRACHLVATHDSTQLSKKDWLATSVRLSDNLALFSKDKLPGMFQYVPGGRSMLLLMGKAAGVKNEKAFEQHRADLHKAIDGTKLSPQLKRDLKASVKELNYLTPKYTMGSLAGEIGSIKGIKGKVRIDVQHNEFDSFLQKHFDMGQSQVRKLLKDFGHTSFSKRVYKLGDFAEIHVIGGKKKKEEADYAQEE